MKITFLKFNNFLGSIFQDKINFMTSLLAPHFKLQFIWLRYKPRCIVHTQRPFIENHHQAGIEWKDVKFLEVSQQRRACISRSELLWKACCLCDETSPFFLLPLNQSFSSSSDFFFLSSSIRTINGTNETEFVCIQGIFIYTSMYC